MEMSLRSTPASSSALRAPSSRRAVIAPLNLAQTIATRNPLPPEDPSRYSPARARNEAASSGLSAVSLLDFIESLEQVTHPFALRAQVVNVKRCRTAFEGNALNDVEAKALEAAVLDRVVGHEAHRRHAEMHQNLRAGAVLARVHRKTLLEVCVHRVTTVFLERVRANLVRESDASTFLASEVDDHARAFGGNLRQGHLQLWATVAAQRSQRVTGQTLRVDPHQQIVNVLNVPVDERDVLFAVEHTLKDVGLELTELRWQRGFGDASDQLLVSAAIANEIGDGDDRQVVTLGEDLEFRQPRHVGLVLGHDFTEHP